MKQVLAMGGGGFTRFQSALKLEKYLLSMSNSDAPKILFLPQASAEMAGYVAKFYESFLSLGARPSWLSLFGRVETGIDEKILSQDIIYVGGGNTKTMLAIWQAWGVDTLLRQAYEQGTIMAGLSAGAICWFEQGVTDSHWPLTTIDCLGFIKGSCCPHYDGEAEREPYVTAALKDNILQPGVALQDDTAVHYVDGVLHTAIKTKDEKVAYAVSDKKQKPLPIMLI